MAKLYKPGRFIGGNGIWGNSVSLVDGDLVSKVGGFIVKTWVWVDVLGVAAGEQSFASNNETVAKARVQFVELDGYSELEMTITGGTITQADEGKYFDITAGGLVDGATESATTGQLKMERFISATKGIFTIANK